MWIYVLIIEKQQKTIIKINIGRHAGLTFLYWPLIRLSSEPVIFWCNSMTARFSTFLAIIQYDRGGGAIRVKCNTTCTYSICPVESLCRQEKRLGFSILNLRIVFLFDFN
jgi:hypothetical protein